MRFRPLLLSTIVLALASCGGGDDSRIAPTEAPLSGTPSSTAGDTQVSEIIVKFAPGDPRAALRELSQEAVSLLSRRAGQNLSYLRTGASNAHVLRLENALDKAAAERTLADISKTDGVAYAEPNLRMTASMVPNDPGFPSQWHLVEPERTLNGNRISGGANAVTAWDITQGDANVTIAVVDTGVLPHADISSRLLPGYDFVSSLRSANDGGGRDSNATDPGDWIAANELAYFGETAPRPSSFHGTHVAGIIAANGNNGIGVAGISWNSRILPVRVLGKGGGTTSDIADGIVWAAGGSVPGVPANPNPARVINLSLGGTGACLATTQNAINYARSRGAVVIVAAGNENESTLFKQPANCQGVITVAAVGWRGAKASYSNTGSAVTLAAPGGDDDGGIISLGDDGRQGPIGNNALVYKVGTSMATPVVSGVAALMLSVNPNLTPDDIKSILRYTAAAFPSVLGKTPCTTLSCGAGIVNALSAVRAAATATTANPSKLPQSGWWYQGEAEGGRGYAIEIHNNSLFMAGFTYQTDGRATWFVSTGDMGDPQNYSGDMAMYSGGQTLGGPFKPASQTGSLGKIKLAFSDASHGRITWPNGQTTDIVRYNIPGAVNGAATVQSGFTPEAGWWWNQAEAGRGFALEVQGDNLFIAGFMYDASGQPTWYVSWGRMTDPKTYSGKWTLYGNGQSIGEAYRSPSVINANVADMKLTFSDGRNAVLSLPNGGTTSLGRFLDFGVQTPVKNSGADLQRMTKMLGKWRFSYFIQTFWIDDFVFNTIYNSELTEGRYVVSGFNQYDRTSVALFYEPSSEYVMLTEYPAEEGFIFDDFYTFTLDSSGTIANGCYFLSYHDGRMSDCYPLSGLKTNYAYDVGPASDPVSAERQAISRGRILEEASAIEATKKATVLSVAPPLKPSAALIQSLRAAIRR